MKKEDNIPPRMPKGWTWVGSNLDLYSKTDRQEIKKKDHKLDNILRNTKLDKEGTILKEESARLYEERMAQKEKTTKAIKEGRYVPKKKKFKRKKKSS